MRQYRKTFCKELAFLFLIFWRQGLKQVFSMYNWTLIYYREHENNLNLVPVNYSSTCYVRQTCRYFLIIAVDMFVVCNMHFVLTSLLHFQQGEGPYRPKILLPSTWTIDICEVQKEFEPTGHARERPERTRDCCKWSD